MLWGLSGRMCSRAKCQMVTSWWQQLKASCLRGLHPYFTRSAARNSRQIANQCCMFDMTVGLYKTECGMSCCCACIFADVCKTDYKSVGHLSCCELAAQALWSSLRNFRCDEPNAGSVLMSSSVMSALMDPIHDIALCLQAYMLPSKFTALYIYTDCHTVLDMSHAGHLQRQSAAPVCAGG